MDWSSFLPDILAGIISGAAVVAGAYVVIDRKLHLRDAAERRAEQTRQEARNREAALTAVHVELESNAAALKFAVEALGKGSIGYPLFDTTTLRLAFEPVIFVTLQTDTVKALLQAFNRMSTANDLHAFVFDFQEGQTAVVTAMVHAVGNESPRSDDAAKNWVEHRQHMSAALLQRCQNLGDYLYAGSMQLSASLDESSRSKQPIATTRLTSRSAISSQA